MDSNTRTMLIVAAVLTLVYFMCSREQSVVVNGDAGASAAPAVRSARVRAVDDGQGGVALQQVTDDDMSMYSDMTESEMTESEESEDSMGSMQVPVPAGETVSQYPSGGLARKFNSRNMSTGGFKTSSYRDGKRGDLGPSNWDKYFDQNNRIIGAAQTGDNDGFLPIDESGGNLAIFKSKGGPVCGSNQNCQPEDLFDVDKYLPQEVNDDWFEVQPEPVSVKNRHLINITKPIGINSVGTSMKNSSYDIRGAPACPKQITSPWLNSNIEADQNLKPLF